ncbi:MAG: PEP-CTERM sorting domain-containing protein [Planctomycetota bacterium]|jgi:hypothetical protein
MEDRTAMNRLIIAFTFALALTAFGSTAEAVTWGFNLSTTGDPCSWGSETAVETGSPQYDYFWQLTAASLLTEGDISVSILDEIQPNSGSGTKPLPFQIFFPLRPLHIELEGITCHIYLAVDGDGYAMAAIPDSATNPLILGTRSGHPVIAAQFSGELTVIPVPEPAMVLLLGAGSLVLIRKRRE